MKKAILALLAIGLMAVIWVVKTMVQTSYYQSAEHDYIMAYWAEKDRHILDMAALRFDKQMNKAKANSFRIERDSLAKEGKRKKDFADKLNLIK